jgi:hypothetical protein
MREHCCCHRYQIVLGAYFFRYRVVCVRLGRRPRGMMAFEGDGPAAPYIPIVNAKTWHKGLPSITTCPTLSCLVSMSVPPVVVWIVTSPAM